MAKSLPLKKGFATLLSFLVLFTAVGPSGLAIKIPTANAATFTVSNLNDSGAGSLRQAIIDANGSVGEDLISFSVAGSINVASDYPTITESVTLDATTTVQAGPNIVLNTAGRTQGLAISGGTNTKIAGIGINGGGNCIGIFSGSGISIGDPTSTEGAVELNGCGNGISIGGGSNITIVNTFIGTSSSNTSNGISVSGASNVTIGGITGLGLNIISGNNQNGIFVTNSSNVTIRNNWIGLNKDSVSDQGNTQSGIDISTGCTNVVIGGSTLAEQNIISGNNQNGIVVRSNGTVIKGNFIGTNAVGSAAVGNSSSGIRLESANNVVGGTTSAERNVISGNGNTGVRIDASVRNSDGNIIRFNYIGQSADGSATIANTGDGIFLSGGTIQNTIIGGDSMGNVISGNTQNGININNTSANTTIHGNIIGLSADGLSARGNGNNGVLLMSGSSLIGLAGNNGGRNIISANTNHGINVQSGGNTIVNNCIGTNGACANDSNLRNNQNGITLQNASAANNTIGGDAAGASNTIHQKTGMLAIMVAGNAGNNNNFSHNDFIDVPAGGIINSVTAPANNGIANPVLTSVIRYTPASVTLVGTTGANNRVDAYAGGLWAGNTTADGSGNFTITANSVAFNYTVTATNGSGSSSGTPVIVAATPDSTAPTAPTASPSESSTAPGSTVAINGTGEKGTSVYSNGIDTGVDVDGSNNFTFNVTVLSGNNTFAITLVDGMSNVSSATDVIVTGVTSGGGGAAAAGGGAGSSHSSGDDDDDDEPETGNVVDEDSQTTIDVGESTEDSGPMAGDEEVSEENNTSDEDNTSDENTNNTQNTGNSQSDVDEPVKGTTPVIQPVKPIKSFVETIYQVIEPIKIKTIRDTLPKDPLVEPKYNKEDLKKIKLFENVSNPYGVPDQIIKIKLGDKGLDTSIEALGFDTDGDGLTNVEEAAQGTDALVKDTDGDGEDDVHEVFVTGTDPTTYDTDRDGLADTVDEAPLVYDNPEDRVAPETVTSYIAEEEITTPLGMTDTDEDGLNDLLEIMLATDPLSSDSDADGLTDGDEWTQYGTDPNAPTSETEIGGLTVVNAINEETVVEGQQFYMGQGPAGTVITFYEVLANGSLVPLGETEADENSRYNLLLDEELKAGKHTLIAFAGNPDEPVDISNPFTVNVIKVTSKPEYVSLNLKNGSSVSERQPTLDLRAADDYMIVVSWRSTIYSQVLIADAADQTVYTKPMDNLELGDHTVTWYAVDPEDNQKSEPTQLAFTVTNAAFLNGENESNIWTIILGSIAVLASLTALGLYLRKPKVTR